MKPILTYGLLLLMVMSLTACKKDWHNNPYQVVGHYRLSIIASYDSAGTLYSSSSIDTIAISYSATYSGGISVSGQDCNEFSQTGDVESYSYSHASGSQIYSFWHGGDSISYEAFIPPVLKPYHWLGRGAKIH